MESLNKEPNHDFKHPVSPAEEAKGKWYSTETEFLDEQKNKEKVLFNKIKDLAKIYKDNYGKVSPDKIKVTKDLMDLRTSIKSLYMRRIWQEERGRFMRNLEDEKDATTQEWMREIINKLYEN